MIVSFFLYMRISFLSLGAVTCKPFLSQVAIFISLCVCPLVSSRHLGVWGELASHKVLQATAPVLKAGHPGVLFFVVGLFSGCLIVCFVVARLFVWVGWLGVFSFLYSLPSI